MRVRVVPSTGPVDDEEPVDIESIREQLELGRANADAALLRTGLLGGDSDRALLAWGLLAFGSGGVGLWGLTTLFGVSRCLGEVKKYRLTQNILTPDREATKTTLGDLHEIQR